MAANPGPCPLDITVRGSIDGAPWVTSVNFDEVRPLTRHLVTACYIVIAYLTGMRASEVLALESGCCPDPGDSDPSRARRSLIYARQFKTARDTDGNHVSAGVLREAPWVAVPQVAYAVRVLEAIAGPGLLSATGRRGRAGRSLGLRTMGERIEEFAAWVNARTFRAGEDATIPDDPHGPMTVSRFRRTLAWHIARQPGGLVALAIQYGHMRTVVSESYSSRARGGIHELLDLETARAVAEHLSDVHESLEQGEGVSGPAARRLIDSARDQHRRFGGLITTTRQAKALLEDPALTVFENPAAYLTCNYEPSRALCNPASGPGPANTPSLDRCRAGCSNIARTDAHAAGLRQAAAALRLQAGASLTPEPVADRLRHRAGQLAAQADEHDRSRLTPATEDPA